MNRDKLGHGMIICNSADRGSQKDLREMTESFRLVGLQVQVHNEQSKLVSSLGLSVSKEAGSFRLVAPCAGVCHAYRY